MPSVQALIPAGGGWQQAPAWWVAAFDEEAARVPAGGLHRASGAPGPPPAARRAAGHLEPFVSLCDPVPNQFLRSDDGAGTRRGAVSTSTDGSGLIEVGRLGLAELGYADAEFVGAGGEGAVFRLDAAHAGKIWLRKTRQELEVLKQFCDDVASAALPFATPRIFVIARLPRFPEYWYTVEAWLPGRPLCPLDAPRPTTEAALDCVVEVVSALRQVPAASTMRALPVLGEHTAPWQAGEDFHTMLQRLVQRRVTSACRALRTVLPHLEALTDRILRALSTLPAAPDCLVHGDLMPSNIMVDERLRPVAVFDFGWFSTAGASAFEAATAASFYDVVFPDGRELEERLEAKLVHRLGFSRRTMAVYRATMAIASAGFQSDDPGDGWFQWCVRVLQRPDIVAALAP